ncbi:hypothetical protein [Nostoc sp.]|uniref:hypothetical protein n=1 Tax=Nostoc sp. TaxID=1180 RepID=UPI002FF77CFD
MSDVYDGLRLRIFELKKAGTSTSNPSLVCLSNNSNAGESSALQPYEGNTIKPLLNGLHQVPESSFNYLRRFIYKAVY